MSDEPVRALPQDGAIDFSRYSTEQLRELQFGIDRDSFPQNYANLSAELARRETTPTPEPTFETRFSRRDGVLGWLEAAGRRSPFYGAGSVQLTPLHLVVHAWRRTWLGAPEQVEAEIPLPDIHNVVRDEARVRFDYKRRLAWHRQIELSAESADQARALTQGLPRELSAGFEQRWAELSEYNRLAKAAAVRVWVTPAVLAVNVLVFAVMAMVAGQLGAFQPQLYLAWGANFGEMTVAGQWWRLVTGLFVHFNLLHLAANMWAFWNIGRLTERLYGNTSMLLVYFGAGILASLTSVLWDPTHYSMGASGAIFGIFGAFLAYLARRETHVPGAVVRAHWPSTTLFVIVNLVSAATQPEIDNAAHVGGLLGGIVLGWILARPLEPKESQEFPFRQTLAASGFLVIATLSFLLHEGHVGLSAPEKYFTAHKDFSSNETKNLVLWQSLYQRLEAGRMTPKELADRIEHDVLPFWVHTEKQLGQEAAATPADQRAAAAALAEVVRLRIAWLDSSMAVLHNQAPNPDANPSQLAMDTDYAEARVERLVTRAALDRRPRALANSRWVESVRELFSGRLKWQCIEEPEWREHPGPQDSKADGPSKRRDAACLAQQLFVLGDYVELDTRLRQARVNLRDLTDGTSTLQGMAGGLDDLFTYGATDFPRLLVATSDWRRAVPGSIQADLVESMIYEAWAWRARGFGGADSVSPEAWRWFNHRNALAAVGLDDLKSRAAQDPNWYIYSIDVGLNLNRTKEELRAIFDAGVKQVPGYTPLHGAMLRSLMPRWGGSMQQVDKFVEDVTNRPGAPDRDLELYARLYWSYDSMEHGDIKLFDDSLAVWPLMKEGFDRLVKHYPQSDAILNAYAKFACIGEDRALYRQLRPSIENRRSAAVWGHSATIESCDGHFQVRLIPGPVAGP